MSTPSSGRGGVVWTRCPCGARWSPARVSGSHADASASTAWQSSQGLCARSVAPGGAPTKGNPRVRCGVGRKRPTSYPHPPPCAHSHARRPGGIRGTNNAGAASAPLAQRPPPRCPPESALSAQTGDRALSPLCTSPHAWQGRGFACRPGGDGRVWSLESHLLLDGLLTLQERRPVMGRGGGRVAGRGAGQQWAGQELRTASTSPTERHVPRPCHCLSV